MPLESTSTSNPRLATLITNANVQANNCQGGATGTLADARLFASWLAAVRAVLSPHGIRLTVAVANWSPVLREFTTLGPSVDRLLDMETYNAKSYTEWLGYYAPLLNAPRAAAGVGLGCWLDGSTAGTWSVTNASAVQRVTRAIADGMPELAMFRLGEIAAYCPSLLFCHYCCLLFRC
jgi:hypothetical protein